MTIPQLTGNGYQQASTSGLTVTQTYYPLQNISASYFKDEDFYSIIFDVDTWSWLASRTTGADYPACTYGLAVAMYREIGDATIFFSTNGAMDAGRPLRPVVSLPSNIKLIEQADGSWTPSK